MTFDRKPPTSRRPHCGLGGLPAVDRDRRPGQVRALVAREEREQGRDLLRAGVPDLPRPPTPGFQLGGGGVVPPAGPLGNEGEEADRRPTQFLCQRRAQPPAAVEEFPNTILLKDYRPQSLYKIPKTEIAKAKFRIIDVHSHDYAKADADVAAGTRLMGEVAVEKQAPAAANKYRWLGRSPFPKGHPLHIITRK